MECTRAQSADEWQRLVDLASSVFSLSDRLPAVVSSLPSTGTPFFDGDVMFGDAGWKIASSLARLHKDPAVNLLVVDPGNEFFLDRSGGYGCFSCPSASSVDGYVSEMFGDPASRLFAPIAYVANVLSIFGASRRWGIWVERNVAGLVTSYSHDLLPAWQIEHGPFLSADEALQDFIAINLGGDSANDPRFSAALRRNYGPFGSD